MVDYVLRQEQLVSDWNKLFEELNIHPIPQLPLRNKSEHSHYSKYYDDDLKEFVYRMYKKDIDVFDYKFETVK